MTLEQQKFFYWATSQSAHFALVIEYVSSIRLWANSRCWINQSECALCFSYVITNHSLHRGPLKLACTLTLIYTTCISWQNLGCWWKMLILAIYRGWKLASEIVYLRHIIMRIKQGCDLNKITRSSKVLNHEILAAQDYSLSENSKFFQSPKGKR